MEDREIMKIGTITVYCPTPGCGRLWEEERGPSDLVKGPNGLIPSIRPSREFCNACVLAKGQREKAGAQT